MLREHLEFKNLRHQIKECCKELGLFTAYNTSLFASRRSSTMVSPDAMIEACISRYPEWEEHRDIVDETVRSLQEHYPNVRVFQDSEIARMQESR